MPHKCLDCKNLIESGTIDLQKGCPVCGGKKFQYIRPRPQPEGPQPEGRQPEGLRQTVSEYVAQAALREPQIEARDSPISRIPGRKPKEAPKDYTRVEATPVRPTEHLPAAKAKPAPRDDITKGEHIESIRIIENGTYDINLPMLLSRKELVMSKEEGNYMVDLNSALKPEKKKRKGRKGR